MWGSEADPKSLDGFFGPSGTSISPLEMSSTSLNCTQQEFIKIRFLALRSHRAVMSWIGLIPNQFARVDPVLGLLNLGLDCELPDPSRVQGV